MKVSISHADLDPLKSALLALAPAVKSSHRVEAMARGLGYGSHAALLAGLAEAPAPCSVDNSAFGAFLKDRGGDDLPWDTLSEAVVRTKLGDARSAIAAVMEREPALCANGLRSYDRRQTPQQNAKAFADSRDKMLGSHYVAQFVRAVEFLEAQEKSTRVNRDRTSYGYKHLAEHFHKERAPGEDPYVANGMFIAAAVHLGFTIKRDHDNSPNVFINIAKPKATRQRTQLAGSMRGAARKAAWRNMMVAAINAGLEQGLFGLAPDDNRFEDNATFRFQFDGLPAIAHIRDISFGELAVHVAVNPTDRAEDWIESHNAGFLAGDAFASGWLEREKGRWLQVSDSPVGCVRTALLDQVVAARVAPKGYADAGRVMM
ncbi:MAG: hypothetical protein ACYDD1_15485 [Caulobacteraceae bacterium]